MNNLRLNNRTYIKQREIDILKNRLNLHKTNEIEDSTQKILYNFKKAVIMLLFQIVENYNHLLKTQ